MATRRVRFAAAAIGVFLVLAAWIFFQTGSREPQFKGPATLLRHPAPEQSGNAPEANAFAELQKSHNASGGLFAEILSIHSILATPADGPDAAESRRLLERLRTEFDKAPLDASASAIIAFLDSGRDAITGLDFRVSDGGILDEAPSLRTALLDALGRVDPIEAAAYSKKILSGSPSSPEFALALRNLEWGGHSESDFELFRRHTLRFLEDDSRALSAEAGYLEGFDAAVRIPDPAVIGILAKRAATQAGRGVQQAALLALDRLSESGDPLVLRAIATDSRIPAIRRAEFLARTDVRDPDQKILLEEFLLHTGNAEAREHFFKTFPLASHTVGPRLITEEDFADAGARRESDAAASAVLKEWMADPRFSSHKQHLGDAIERMRDFSGDGP